MDNQTAEGDGTWLPSAAASGGGMTRSLSEWEFQQFLEEFDRNQPKDGSHARCENVLGSESTSPGVDQIPLTRAVAESIAPLPPPPPPPPPPPMYSDEYQAYLRSRLQFECATVAFIRSTNAESGTSSATSTSALGSQTAPGVRCNPANTLDEDAGSSIDKTRARGRSSSASETSEAEGETETTQDVNVTSGRQNKRKLLNRESARRSRRRKHEQTAKLETSVAELADEKVDLLKRLNDIMHKSNQEAETNKILRVQADSLRSQVKLIEEVVKRVASLSSDRSSGQQTVPPVPQVHQGDGEIQPHTQISGPAVQKTESANGHHQDTRQNKTRKNI